MNKQRTDRLFTEKLAQAGRIRGALDKKNWSAGRLAKEMTSKGVKTSRTTAYQWIDSESPSSPSDWSTLAEVLGEAVEWLRDGKSTSHSAIDGKVYLKIFKIVAEETTAMGYSLSPEQLSAITITLYNRTPSGAVEIDRSLVSDFLLYSSL